MKTVKNTGTLDKIRDILFISIMSLLLFGFMHSIVPQQFIRVTDNNNAVVTANFPTNYSGAAWIDYDNDGDEDLFATYSLLFNNDGNGSFTLAQSGIGSMQQFTLASGVSWGDVDNDGDADCLIAGFPSMLYLNNNGSFTAIMAGGLGIDSINTGWTAAFADYDEDSYLDAVITNPDGFTNNSVPSHFQKGNGDGRFEKLRIFHFNQMKAPYTVPVWSDYDLDGDTDLFIASGPAGSPGVDYNYKNSLTETGTAGLHRIETAPFGTDLQDGQVYNFIDYDNDGDLDVFITNYGGAANSFYQNNNGSYLSVQNALTFNTNCLSNTWGDIDNDGYLDVIITDETKNYLFKNMGNGTFQQQNDAFTVNGTPRGAVLGDYDNDGDLDLFVTGSGNAKGLFRNDYSGMNNWAIFKLEGTVSNRSAIGAKIRLKATINGNSVWQIREIQAQNSFNSHNSLRAHFGLAGASIIDSLIILWPSGQQKVLTGLPVNSIQTIKEDIPSGYIRANFSADLYSGITPMQVSFRDLSFTDPEMPVTSYQWDFNNDGIIDAAESNPSWTYNEAGVYSIKLVINNGSVSKTILKEDYIEIRNIPGIPLLVSTSPAFTDTIIPKNGKVFFTASAMDTSGYEIAYKWLKNGVEAGADSFYNYASSPFFPAPRTDTITLNVSNGYNFTSRSWLIHVDPSISNIDEGNNIPAEFSLAQNYPNPFNPSTIIEYSVAEDSDVNISIYDLLGNRIVELIDDFKHAGRHSLIFNAEIKGESLPSGIYFISMKAGGFSSVKKMMLIR